MSQLNFNRLRNDIGEPVVYDVVPDSERERESYRYWRGLSLARLALELSRGNRTFQFGTDGVHFADFHLYAYNVARDIAAGASPLQTQPEDCSAIQQAIGERFTSKTPHPALVVAYARPNAYVVPSDRGLCHGVTLYGQLTDLDKHSQEFVQDYFGLSSLT
ncbi:hypothetical protein FBF32_03770 [Candidatus Saccharibacteria bacterium oral taxon 488]|jgi:hypothetical protein|nr:hypothetical protein FBF32_03770 [Candidatus Saccharibacteria bacterium oral taxon 488]